MHRPFTLESIQPFIGRNVKPIVKYPKKVLGKTGVMIVAAGKDCVILKNRVSRSLTEVTYPALLNQYVLDSGAPCGMRILSKTVDGYIFTEAASPETPPPPPEPVKMNLVDRLLLIKEDLVSLSREEISALDIADILEYTQIIERFIIYMSEPK